MKRIVIIAIYNAIIQSKLIDILVYLNLLLELVLQFSLLIRENNNIINSYNKLFLALFVMPKGLL